MQRFVLDRAIIPEQVPFSRQADAQSSAIARRAFSSGRPGAKYFLAQLELRVSLKVD